MSFTTEANAILVIVALIGKIICTAELILITRKYNQNKDQGKPEDALISIRLQHEKFEDFEFLINIFFIVLSAILSLRIVF